MSKRKILKKTEALFDKDCKEIIDMLVEEGKEIIDMLVEEGVVGVANDIILRNSLDPDNWQISVKQRVKNGILEFHYKSPTKKADVTVEMCTVNRVRVGQALIFFTSFILSHDFFDKDTIITDALVKLIKISGFTDVRIIEDEAIPKICINPTAVINNDVEKPEDSEVELQTF